MPLQAETRETFLLPADHLIQQPCGGTLGLPRGVGVNVHRGTDVSVSQQAQLYRGKNFTSCFLQDGDALVLKTDYPGLPIWVHTFNPVTLNGIKILMELCRKYPTVPVIFGHMGGSNWMDVIAFAKEQGNAYLDLSAAFTPLSVKTALTEVPERCLFGSDAPFGEPKLCRQLIEFVSPSTSATEMALGGNIERLLQI